jgi:isopenicillin-N epimerase
MVTGDLWTRVAEARTAFATFLGAEPELCAMVNNATFGTALVLNSLDLRDGDEIIITDHNYHAVTLAVESLSRRLSVKIITTPVELESPAAETVAAITDRVTEHTRLVIADEVFRHVPTASDFRTELCSPQERCAAVG